MSYAAVLRKDHHKKEAVEMEARARESRAMHDRDDAGSAMVDWHELHHR